MYWLALFSYINCSHGTYIISYLCSAIFNSSMVLVLPVGSVRVNSANIPQSVLTCWLSLAISSTPMTLIGFVQLYSELPWNVCFRFTLIGYIQYFQGHLCYWPALFSIIQYSHGSYITGLLCLGIFSTPIAVVLPADSVRLYSVLHDTCVTDWLCSVILSTPIALVLPVGSVWL